VFTVVAKYQGLNFTNGRQACDFRATNARYVRVKSSKLRATPLIPLAIKSAVREGGVFPPLGQATRRFRLQELEVYE